MEQELQSLRSLSSTHSLENEWIQIRNHIFGKYAFFLGMGANFSHTDTHQTDLQLFMNSLLLGTESGACTISLCLLLAIQTENLSSLGMNQFLQHTRYLFSNALPLQLLFVSKQAVIVSEYIVKEVTNAGYSSSVVNMLMHAAKILSHDTNLTPIHSHVLQCCLSSRHFRVAEKFLKSLDGLIIDPASCFITPADCLAYYYYSALCFIAIENYQSALIWLNEAITTPSQCLSSIIIISIKKANLVSLLYLGEKYILPKTVSGIVQRFCQEELQLYEQISTLFFGSDQAGLIAFINEIGNKKKLQENNDFGLANLLLDAMIKQNVKKHSNAYMNIPISTLTELIKAKSIEDTEKFLLSHDCFNCTLDKATQIVYFENENEEEEDLTELREITMLLQEELNTTAIISAQVRDMFSTLYTSKLFVKNIRQSPL